MNKSHSTLTVKGFNQVYELISLLQVYRHPLLYDLSITHKNNPVDPNYVTMDQAALVRLKWVYSTSQGMPAGKLGM